MNDDEIQALKAKRQEKQDRLTRLVEPRGSGFAPSFSPPPIIIKTINWEVWGNMLEVEWHEACALALNVDPSLVVEVCDDMHPHASFYRMPSEIKEDFSDLMKLLRSNLPGFTKTHRNTVLLQEFANWCVRINWKNIPSKLAAMAKDAPQAASTTRDEAALAAKVEDGSVTSQGGDNREKQAPAADDYAEELAALFEPVTVEALEKMFPAAGKWKGWAEKAKANKLIGARTDRGLFNPYKAGVWLLSTGIKDWDIARLNRVLAKNLPARSHNKGNMLVGDID